MTEKKIQYAIGYSRQEKKLVAVEFNINTTTPYIVNECINKKFLNVERKKNEPKWDSVFLCKVDSKEEALGIYVEHVKDNINEYYTKELLKIDRQVKETGLPGIFENLDKRHAEEVAKFIGALTKEKGKN